MVDHRHLSSGHLTREAAAAGGEAHDGFLGFLHFAGADAPPGRFGGEGDAESDLREGQSAMAVCFILLKARSRLVFIHLICQKFHSPGRPTDQTYSPLLA